MILARVLAKRDEIAPKRAISLLKQGRSLQWLTEERYT